MRADGRRATQLRPLGAEQGLLNRADGSARASLGDSAVMVGVMGPRPPRWQRQELPDRAALEVVWRPAAGMGAGGPTERALERDLRGVLERVVAVELHPRTLISLTVQVLADAGALLAAAVSAACLALLDAGVPLRATVAAGTAAWCSRPDAADGAHSASVLVDPLPGEGDAVATVAISSRGEDLLCTTHGARLAPAELEALLAAARDAARTTLAFLQESHRRALKAKALETNQ